MAGYGERWPNPRPAIIRWAQKLILGPSGPNAVALDWHRTERVSWLSEQEAVFQALHDQGVRGDPNAPVKWPRRWTKGVGLAVLSSIVERESDAGAKQQGVAYFNQQNGWWVAGTLPEGTEFGHAQIDGQSYRTVVARVGRNMPVITPVMIHTETSSLRFPFDLTPDHRGDSIIPRSELQAVGGLMLAQIHKHPIFADTPVV